MPSLNIPIGQAFHSLGQGMMAHPALTISMGSLAACTVMAVAIAPHLTLTFGGPGHVGLHVEPRGDGGLFRRLARGYRRGPAYGASTSA